VQKAVALGKEMRASAWIFIGTPQAVLMTPERRIGNACDGAVALPAKCMLHNFIVPMTCEVIAQSVEN
jgi:hypothetical protein